MTQLVWFRTDLRIHDNPALMHACRHDNSSVMAVAYITPTQWQKHGLGERKINLIKTAILGLKHQLQQLNIPLLIRYAETFDEQASDIISVCQALDVHELCFNIEYELNERRRDIQVGRACQESNIDVYKFHDQCLLAPGELKTQQGEPYRVYSPFRKAWTKVMSDALQMPYAKPTKRSNSPETKLLEAWQQAEPQVTADELWNVDEEYAHVLLNDFLDERGKEYNETRDLPSVDGTSRLSALLSLGVLSPRQCVYSAWQRNGQLLIGGYDGLDCWINELIWREFYRHLIVAYPELCKHKAFKPDTETVEWRYSESDFDAWREGRTGYPIVDAAMKQLLDQGWMHNRLRMITAMFLTKHLLIDWRWGEAHFNKHLVDADFASNNGGWQWSASTGADGAPYFRIFNPTSQSQKFDKDGQFITKYLPKLAALPAKARHEPSPLERQQCDYDSPVVEHKFGRQRALDAFKLNAARLEAAAN